MRPPHDVVDGDRTALLGGHRTVREHQWDTALTQPGQPGGVRAERHHHRADRPLFDEHGEVALLPLRCVPAVAQDEGVAVLVRRVRGAARDARVEGVGHVRQDQADRRGMPGAQPGGSRVGDVVEGGDRVTDPLGRARVDPLGPVQDVRHRGDRDPGGGRDVLDTGGANRNGVHPLAVPHGRRKSTPAAVKTFSVPGVGWIGIEKPANLHTVGSLVVECPSSEPHSDGGPVTAPANSVKEPADWVTMLRRR